MKYGSSDGPRFNGHPRFMPTDGIRLSAVTFGESMVAIQPDLSPGPLLAESWNISNDGRIWTWRVRDDVEFHHKCGLSGDQSCGILTVHDVLWNYKEYHEGYLHLAADIIGDYWVGKAGGSQKIIDDFTVEIDTGKPLLRDLAFDFMRHLGGASTTIVSKRQTQEKVEAWGGGMADTSTTEYEGGAIEAGVLVAATGPWEVEEHQSGSFWRFKAVESHWRQTPYFAELKVWFIPEESTRIAGFYAGNLDIVDISSHSLNAVQASEGTEIIVWPNAGQVRLNIYGQTYGVDKDGNPYKDLNCNNPWVSCNQDSTSAEWRNAVKVKKAMAIAINRQEIVDTLLSGYGQPLHSMDWLGHEDKADPNWTHEYNPNLARQLLEEAGYGDGFSITLTTTTKASSTIRAEERKACEAVADYWKAIGIKPDFRRNQQVDRKYQGVACYTVSRLLTPAIGTPNYLAESAFSYGTEHPWLEENITDLLSEANPAHVAEKERKVYGWMYENVMAFGLYSMQGIWPVGKRLDPDWRPIDYSELRYPSGFEYIKHRE